MTTYSEAIAFLESFIDYERHRGLMKYNTRALHIRRFERFLRRVGSPHRAVPIVHLAGTKGKGSTAAILHSIAAEAGLRPGLFTSPHLESYCERVRIGREPVAKRRFAEAVDRLRRRLVEQGQELEPGYRTTFELLTTLAFELFRDERAGLGVLETGLGGRLDATNVARPELAVITAIGLDHTHLLGTTHVAIAREKAGIVKPGRPVLVGRQSPGKAREVLAAIRGVCRRRGSPMSYAPRLVRIESAYDVPGGQRVRCRFVRTGVALHLDLPLLGPHQLDNLQTALAAVEILRTRGWEIPDRSIARGVARTDWPGRVEWLDGRPALVLDGAHCPLSVEALARTLERRCPGRRLVFLFSLLDDKPVGPTVRPLGRRHPGSAMVVFRAPSVRGRSPDGMLDTLRGEGFSPTAARSAAEAVRRARELAGPDAVVVAFGTLYSIEPIRKAFRRLTRRAVAGYT